MNPQEPVKNELKWAPPSADDRDVTSEITAPVGDAPTALDDDVESSMRHLIDQVVDHVPGVLGAVVSSIDGFVLGHRLHATAGSDAAAVAAMSAAVLALSNRMVQLTGPASIDAAYQRSGDGQVFVFSISQVAVLTIITTPSADAEQIGRVGHEITRGLHRAFTAPTTG